MLYKWEFFNLNLCILLCVCSTNINKEMSEDRMTDLERFQAKANSVTDSSLESTRRMMSMVNEVIRFETSQSGPEGMF